MLVGRLDCSAANCVMRAAAASGSDARRQVRSWSAAVASISRAGASAAVRRRVASWARRQRSASMDWPSTVAESSVFSATRRARGLITDPFSRTEALRSSSASISFSSFPDKASVTRRSSRRVPASNAGRAARAVAVIGVIGVIGGIWDVRPVSLFVVICVRSESWRFLGCPSGDSTTRQYGTGVYWMDTIPPCTGSKRHRSEPDQRARGGRATAISTPGSSPRQSGSWRCSATRACRSRRWPQEAGTTRQALYRRWPSKADLAGAAVVGAARTAPSGAARSIGRADRSPTPSRPGRRTDRLPAQGLTSGPSVPGRDDAPGEHGPDVRERYRARVIHPRRHRITAILEAARQLALIDQDADLTVAVAMCTGAWYGRALAGDPVPAEWPTRTAALVWRAVGGDVRRTGH